MNCRKLSTLVVLALANVPCCSGADAQSPSKAAPPAEAGRAVILQCSAGRIQIAVSPQVGEEMHDRLPEDNDALTIVCRDLRIVAGSLQGQGTALQIECIDAVLICGGGWECRAGRLQLDAAKRRLRLADAELFIDHRDDEPSAKLRAKEVLLDLNESSAVLRGIQARGPFKSSPE